MVARLCPLSILQKNLPDPQEYIVDENEEEKENTMQITATAAEIKALAANADAIEEIVFQKRVELWGEGQAYYDLMRLKKGVDRRGAGFAAHLIFNIPAGDKALIYPIPQAEMERNPLIGENNPLIDALPTPVTE